MRFQLAASRTGGEGAAVTGFNSSTAAMIRYYLTNSSPLAAGAGAAEEGSSSKA